MCVGEGGEKRRGVRYSDFVFMNNLRSNLLENLSTTNQS